MQKQAVLDFGKDSTLHVGPFRMQLLKWIGNKQRFAHEIAQYFPNDIRVYREPFLGSGAVLGTLAPNRGIGSDGFEPLASIWVTLKNNPAKLKDFVTTPAGTTMDGIMALEEGGIRVTLIRTVLAATRKSQELSRQTGQSELDP